MQINLHVKTLSIFLLEEARFQLGYPLKTISSTELAGRGGSLVLYYKQLLTYTYYWPALYYFIKRWLAGIILQTIHSLYLNAVKGQVLPQYWIWYILV